MSRKHFIELAKSLKAAKPRIDDLQDSVRLATWESTVRQVARVCAETNPRFNYSRFYEACGLES